MDDGTPPRMKIFRRSPVVGLYFQETMEELSTLRQYLPLLIPILIIQLALVVAALLDLSRRSVTRGPRWV